MAKPILKWAGGKGQLIGELFKHLKPPYCTYYEPFVGGGALFFAMEQAGGYFEKAVLADTCECLIQTYRYVVGYHDFLIVALEQHQAKHSKEYYYEIRDRANKDGWAAGRFIYLNRTGYNGLYRVNKKGEFNVPIGRYTNPRICDAEGLRAASQALQNVELLCGDFAGAVITAQAGDLVYFDPPYLPVKANSFVAYGSTAFGELDHERLVVCAEELVQKGVHVVMSNADVPWIRNRLAGNKWLQIHPVITDRQVNSKAGGRKQSAAEVIITGVTQ